MFGVWRTITDLGDAAVTVPVAVATAGFLVVARWPRAAALWLLAVGTSGALLAALKFGFASCGRLAPGTILSPSGHAAMSMAVFGSLAVLVGARSGPGVRRGLFAATAALVVAIGLSRVILGAHTLPEVAIGAGAGALAVGGFRHGLAKTPTGRPAWPVLIGGLAVLALALHGQRWPIDAEIRHLALRLGQAVPACSHS